MNFNFQNLIRSANASLIVYAKLCGRIRDANDFIFRIQIYSWNQFGMQEMKKKIEGKHFETRVKYKYYTIAYDSDSDGMLIDLFLSFVQELPFQLNKYASHISIGVYFISHKWDGYRTVDGPKSN